MQKSLSNSFRRIKKDGSNAKNKDKSIKADNSSQSSSEISKQYVDVGVQTDDTNVSPSMLPKICINE
jgi:hypothetical protein